MFHTLSELNEKEKNKGKFIQNDNLLYMKKGISPQNNYYGKGNKAYDYYNKIPPESLNEKFEKTRNKIKLIVFKNGFILNNGPFRDRILPENNQFMEEVERGNIPHELMDKGINDLGILLINRKSEIYHRPITPITQITQITQINPININPYNQFRNFDFGQIGQYGQYNQLNTINNYPYLDNKINQNYNIYTSNNNNYNNYAYNNNNYNTFTNNNKIGNDYQYKYNTQTNNKNQFGNYKFQNPLFLNIESLGYSLSNNPPETPIGNRNIRRDIFVPNAPYTENRNYNRYNRYSSSVPKKDMKIKFETFHNFKRLEITKEEEKKLKKQQNKINNKKEKETDNIEEKEEKKFKAFGGMGQAVGFINIEGLNIHKELKNSIDIFKPICIINIRLFNGEIVKGQFNYSQTLRDIYYYVRKISGSDNFTLLEGFPPRPLIYYDMTIGQLKLENTTLTQKIN